MLDQQLTVQQVLLSREGIQWVALQSVMCPLEHRQVVVNPSVVRQEQQFLVPVLSLGLLWVLPERA